MFSLYRLEDLAELASRGLFRLNSKILKALGKQIANARNGGFDRISILSNADREAERLLLEILKELNIATAEASEIYAQAAKLAYQDMNKCYAARGLTQIPIDQQRAIVNFVQGIAATTRETFANLSNTTAIGFRVLGLDGKVRYKAFRRHYHDLVDQAISEVATGQVDYRSAFRHAMRQTADSGIRIIDYESGYSRRLDSAMRQNILDGVKDIAHEVAKQAGEQFGADGVEISAHNNCAPDHLPYQGRQFSKQEFEDIQESLHREFGMWNCRHTIFSIILGLSEPLYTEEERQQMITQSTAVKEFEGKSYTAYEATQLQRRIETEIRKRKDRVILAKEAGDDIGRRVEQLKINQLQDKYLELSKTFELPLAKDRMTVAEFRPVKVNSEVIDSKLVIQTKANVFQADKDIAASAQLAENAMINVHGRGNLPSIPIVKNNRIKADGEFRYLVPSGQVMGIHIKMTRSNPELAILHEYGHYIDMKAFSQNGVEYATSLNNPILNGLFDALNKSKCVIALRREVSKASISKEISEYLKYLLKPKELFARSYSQYIATKSGDPTLLTQLDNERASSLFKTLWDDGDFIEIMKEFDIIITGLKWKKKSN